MSVTQALFDELYAQGQVEGAEFDRFQGQNVASRHMRMTSPYSRDRAFTPGDTIQFGGFNWEYNWGGDSGKRGYWARTTAVPEPLPEMPDFNFDFEMPEFDLPEIPVQAPANLEVQGLKSKRGRISDLRVTRELGPGQVSQLQAAANRAGLNLPV